MTMKIILATDHAGFAMKEHIKGYLTRAGHAVEDVGAHTLAPDDDYPVYMQKAAKLIAGADDTVGVVFGGSGQGEAIVLNRFRGVRAMVYAVSNPELVKVAREHNNINALSIGARSVSNTQAEVAVEIFLATSFSGEERHQRRIDQIDTIV